MQEGEAAALPPEAVVIRGGDNVTPERLRAAFEDHFIRSADDPNAVKGYCISVNCGPNLSLDELAQEAQRPNRQLCVSTVEQIANAGFVVAPSTGPSAQRRLHCDVYLATGAEEMPTPEQLKLLSAAFGPSVPNPAR